MFERSARRLSWAALWLSVPFAAQAESITYRCSKPGEAVRYQSLPCPDSSQLVVKTADVRTDAQRRDTARATQTGAKLGRQMERERRRDERRAAATQGPIAMDSAIKPRPVAAAASSTSTPLKRERHFTVRIPKTKAPSAKSA
ncbi:MAG: hypothetical protein EOP38_22225 [Rubrivivax sp.]|nr:MAG: hypothetical protein EOP38_22225 [Rubrivivax sp.]